MVDGDAETGFRNTQIGRKLSRCQEEVTQDSPVVLRSLADPGDRLFRNDEDVHRCLGGDVAESAAQIVLMNDFRGNLAVVDFLKKRLHWWIESSGWNRKLKPGIQKGAIPVPEVAPLKV